MLIVFLWFGWASFESTGCTVEAPEGRGEPLVEVLATSPAPLATGVARDSLIHFWFSAPLDPGSVGPDAIRVRSGEVGQSGNIHYDPVDWRLTYRPRGALRVDLAYDATLSADLRGLREGSPVESEPLTFVTGDQRAHPPVPTAPVYEREIEPIFQRSCSVVACHGGASPAAGLDLSGRDGLLATALDVQSGQWRGWDVIATGSASYSYLVYKVMGEPTVRGTDMPPGAPLPLEEIRAIAAWIDGGAKVDPDGAEP